jgi:Na+-translocating ferredoxin:NAD+ oxidoreductase RnfG subunit
MMEQTTNKLGIILALFAAALALLAAVIDYMRRGEINLMPILGTCF